MNDKTFSKNQLIKLNKSDYVFPDLQMTTFYEPGPNHPITGVPVPWLTTPVTYTINSDSLNSSKEYEVLKPNNTFRVMALGDSFTYGLYVNTQDNWPSQLEQSLNNEHLCNIKYEVINLGVPGYDIGFSVKRFISRGKKYNPDLIIWLLKSDDFLEYNDFLFKQANRIISENKIIDTDENTKSINFEIAMKKALNIQNQTFTKKELLIIQNSVINNMLENYQGTLLILEMNSNNDQQLLQWVTANKKIFIMKNIDMGNYQDSHYPDSHPNKLGHQLISSSVFNYLQNTKLIPCIK